MKRHTTGKDTGNGVSRRGFLTTTGGIAALGASRLAIGPDALEAAVAKQKADRLPGFGKAKSVIVFHLYGSPSQMETLDPKPDAPTVKQGGIKSIPSSIPGVHVSDLLPEIGKRLHKFALIRSMSHSSNNHAVSVALSGLSKSVPAIEANGDDTRHVPYIGSVLEMLLQHQGVNASSTGVPVHMVLPWDLNVFVDPKRWTPNACWLGRQYDPVSPQFIKQKLPKDAADKEAKKKAKDFPFYGLKSPKSTFRFKGTNLPQDVSRERLVGRRSLLRGLGGHGSEYLDAARSEAFDLSQQVAFNMILDPKVAQAVDFARAATKVREHYGIHLLGQQLLAARRLVEAGVKMVTCFWDVSPGLDNAWDTHSKHFPNMKEFLCPMLDKLLPAFLTDMEERGLLDDTLVMVLTEHGRTPHLNKNNGRDHWSGAYWELFFGAGIQTDRVIGSTDKLGAYPTSQPYDPKDVLATMYHLLGFDPHHTTYPDRFGRPVPILPHGEVIRDLVV